MLDKNPDIIQYLQKHTTIADVCKNITIDRENEVSKRKDRETRALKIRYKAAVKLLNNDLNIEKIPESIVIYGAGNIGRAFYNRCKDKCTVECFIDKKYMGQYYDNVPILSLNEIDMIKCKDYIITATYDIVNIQKELPNNVHLISLDDLFV